LLYNIRYATGSRQPRFPWSGYFRRTSNHLDEIIRFIKPLQPDIMGLVEVDGGSYRSRKVNQAEFIANELGHYHAYRGKYSEQARIPRNVPVMNMQGNAFITRDTIHDARYHYFDKGFKRLVIELEMENLVIFLVHLALSFRIRHQQLAMLYELVKGTEKPHIVAGDFNALWGENEIDLFLAASGLRNVNQEGNPSFPSWAPKRHLDFILCSEGIHADRFWMPEVTLSDHLPLVFDFHVDGE
jgi:endonuclease/exonuclease/phosphatase family metal-dependent hydrolase